jgi:hypothetical protein
MAEYEKAALGTVDVKVIILKCELHTGNGFVAAEGTGARRIDQDRGDINKSLKMSMKSAHIDATLRVAGLSELFSQDIEDMFQDKAGKQDMQPGDIIHNHPSPPAQPQPAPTPPPPPRVPATNGQNGGTKSPANNGQNQTTNGQSHESNRITSKQHSFIMNLIQTAKMTKTELNQHCVEAYGSVVDHITRHDASSLIDWLRKR